MNPLLIVIEVLLVLGLWALFLVLAGRAGAAEALRRPLAGPTRALLGRERQVAADLGWPYRGWIALRVSVALAGLLVGIWLVLNGLAWIAVGFVVQTDC